MRITFSPSAYLPYEPKSLTLERTAPNRLRINGELFNFGPMEDGDVIEPGTVPCEWITGTVEKIDGEVQLTLILPHGPNPSQAVAFPVPITVTEDGPIAVPHDEPEQEEPADVDA
jgi:hypothetical protein